MLADFVSRAGAPRPGGARTARELRLEQVLWWVRTRHSLANRVTDGHDVSVWGAVNSAGNATEGSVHLQPDAEPDQ